MKKTVVALLLAFLMILGTAHSFAEAVTPPEAEALWTITIETADGEIPFTSIDAEPLTPVTMEATTTNKKGESSTSTYVGVALADILAALEITEFSGVSIVASDDFAADYSKELALDGETVLAWEKDGEPISTDPPLQMAPKNGVGNQFVKAVAKIVVLP